jgi:hypothetical protein
LNKPLRASAAIFHGGHNVHQRFFLPRACQKIYFSPFLSICYPVLLNTRAPPALALAFSGNGQRRLIELKLVLEFFRGVLPEKRKFRDLSTESPVPKL